MPDNRNWDEMVLDVVRAAKNRLSIDDFRTQCRLSPVSNGKSYHDRMRVADTLITQRIIELDNNYLRIAMKEIPDWLSDGLKVGSDLAWEIFENVDHTHKFTQKIDRLLLEKIGLEGEYAVIELLKSELLINVLHRIKHISLSDDSVGFDIQSPSIRNSVETMLLEVKTTSRPGYKFNFYISRNEARIAAQNENWRLVGVLRRPSGYEIIGHINFVYFSQFLPNDAPLGGRWESAHITIPVEAFLAGLP